MLRVTHPIWPYHVLVVAYRYGPRREKWGYDVIGTFESTTEAYAVKAELDLKGYGEGAMMRVRPINTVEEVAA